MTLKITTTSKPSIGIPKELAGTAPGWHATTLDAEGFVHIELSRKGQAPLVITLSENGDVHLTNYHAEMRLVLPDLITLACTRPSKGDES